MRWLTVLVFLVIIAYFSSQPFAEQDLQPEIEKHGRFLQVVRKLPEVRFSYDGQMVDNRLAPVDFVQFWLRKGAHILLYGVFGLALLSTLGKTGLRGFRGWLTAGFVMALVAPLDECHQLSVPGRTGRVLDILVDLVGFVFFTFVAGLYSLVSVVKRKGV